MRNVLAVEPLFLLPMQKSRAFEQQRGGEDVARHRGQDVNRTVHYFPYN